MSETTITPSVVAQIPSVLRELASRPGEERLKAWLDANPKALAFAVEAAVFPVGARVEFLAKGERLSGTVSHRRVRGPTAGYVEVRTDQGVFGVHRDEWRKIGLIRLR